MHERRVFRPKRFGVLLSGNATFRPPTLITSFCDLIHSLTVRSDLLPGVNWPDRGKDVKSFSVPESRKSVTVLLVDDNDSLRTGLTKVLTRKGYRAFEAPDPEHALSLMKHLGNELDVLVTDIVMPGMNGFELSRRVHRIYPKIGIIHMSAYGIAETAGSEFNNDVVLAKPVPISVLVEAVERLVRRDPGNSGGG